MTIYGQGEQERDYLYVDDLIEAFLLSLTPKSAGRIYNLGYGKGIKFIEMAKLIIKIVGRGNLKFVKWPQDFKKVETGSYVSDITKIREDLGFIPRITFEKGIQKNLVFIA